MAEFDFTLQTTPVLGGASLSIGTNEIRERSDLEIVSIAIPTGGSDALKAALKVGWGLDFPTPSVSCQSQGIRAIWTAPDQVLLVGPMTGPDPNATVKATLGGAGYTTAQTGAWVMLEVSGEGVLAALERLHPLDSASLLEGGSARTVMEHMSAIIVRLSQDRFWLLSASSSARSFLHAVETSFRNTAQVAPGG